jgi:hypothetical protein
MLNDALSIYFLDASLANAFLARWWAGNKAEAAEGVFRIRTDRPAPRTGATMHRTLGVAESAFSYLRADANVQGSAPAACAMIGRMICRYSWLR